MTIQDSSVVSLLYKLSNHQTGEKIEETSSDNPMVFLVGVGQVIPEFEENLKGKKAGDTFSFAIESTKAYGQKHDDNIAIIPIDVFHDENGKFDEAYFKLGALIPMSDSEGNNMRGTIVGITDEVIKMDFNHPLAGIDLHFEGEIVDIREATKDEIDHGHVHGPGGHHH